MNDAATGVGLGACCARGLARLARAQPEHFRGAVFLQSAPTSAPKLPPAEVEDEEGATAMLAAMRPQSALRGEDTSSTDEEVAATPSGDRRAATTVGKGEGAPATLQVILVFTPCLQPAHAPPLGTS